MSLKKFEVLEGKHFEQTGTRNQGQIIEKVYKKGEVVSSHEDLDKMFLLKFKRRHDLEGGSAKQEEAKVEVAANNQTVIVPPDSEDAADVPVPAKTKADAEAKTAPIGKNVTKNYPQAEKSGVLVFKTDAGYFFSTPDAPTKALNKDAVPRNRVEVYIKKHFKK